MRPNLVLASFWVIIVVASLGFMVGGFTNGTPKGIFVGTLGAIGLVSVVVFLLAVLNQRRRSKPEASNVHGGGRHA